VTCFVLCPAAFKSFMPMSIVIVYIYIAHNRKAFNALCAVRTADGSRRTADAADEQCLRCGSSSPSCTVVLCAADIGGPLRTACTASDEECPVSAARV